MRTVREIIEAIGNLSLGEKMEFYKWLNRWEDDEWDQQMKRDIESGHWDEFLAKVDREIAQGRLMDMP